MLTSVVWLRTFVVLQHLCAEFNFVLSSAEAAKSSTIVVVLRCQGRQIGHQPRLVLTGLI